MTHISRRGCESPGPSKSGDFGRPSKPDAPKSQSDASGCLETILNRRDHISFIKSHTKQTYPLGRRHPSKFTFFRTRRALALSTHTHTDTHPGPDTPWTGYDPQLKLQLTLLRTSRASASFPVAINHRGDSGMSDRHARMSSGGSMPIPIMDRHLAESELNTSEHSKLAPYLFPARSPPTHSTPGKDQGTQ